MHPEINLIHKGRLEALSDGVFGVVMTLLVLDLKPELVGDSKGVWGDLAAIKHTLVIYAVTFTLTGMFWILQSRLFANVLKATSSYAWLTLLFLFWVTLLPFTFSLTHRGDGMVLYFADMTLIGVSLLAGWWYAHGHGMLADDSGPIYRVFAWRIGVLVIGCASSMILSIFMPSYAWLALVAAIVLGRLAVRKLILTK